MRSRAKPGKKDCYGLIYPDQFAYGTNRLYIMLALIFQLLIIRAYSANGINTSTVQTLLIISENHEMIRHIFRQ